MPDDYPGAGASDDEIDAARTAALDAILNADQALKVAVAGPGTGKTHTFKSVVDQTDGRVLILTFLTSLVADLKAKLEDSADIFSFHGFAKHELHRCGADGIDQNFDYYPALELIFVSDMQITDQVGSRDEISDAVMNLRTDGQILPLVLRSGNYYNAVSHSDAVYRLLTTFQAHPDLVPEFAHVLVDEYQDFGLMEVELIRALAVQSPTLVVGDDDQALYRFRYASPEYIRALVAGAEYANFVLPYCSRCTAVLVEATHLLVQRAQESGLLADRIAKPYLCYLPGKRADSEAHPRIIHARCSVDNNKSPYMARYVAEQIRQIPQAEVDESREEGYPTVLIVGQRQFTTRVEALLTEQGFSVTRKGGAKLALRLSDGYRRLATNEASRLGWRILLELHQPPGWEEWVTRALLEDVEVSELIDDDYRNRQLEIAGVVGMILKF